MKLYWRLLQVLTGLLVTPICLPRAAANEAEKCLLLVLGPQTPVVQNLPADLKQLAIDAATSVLSSPIRPESLGPDSPGAIKNLLMYGGSQVDVLRKVSARLEQFIQTGRDMGRRLALTDAASFFFTGDARI